MLTVVMIGLGVMVLIGSAAMAFSFGGDEESEQPRVETPATQPGAPLVFFQPTGWSADVKQVPIAELVASIEEHLGRERAAAETFARNPSARNLWLD